MHSHPPQKPASTLRKSRYLILACGITSLFFLITQQWKLLTITITINDTTTKTNNELHQLSSSNNPNNNNCKEFVLCEQPVNQTQLLRQVSLQPTTLVTLITTTLITQLFARSLSRSDSEFVFLKTISLLVCLLLLS